MTGVFSLSFDVELAWGFVHRNNINQAKLKEISISVRSVLGDLLALLERYEISATWNILGHLMLDHCEKENPKGLPHADMPRPEYSWLRDDWYRYDPCTDLPEDPAWYGKDVVDRIVQHARTSKVPHEIGCHSFSHQQFGDPGCTEELARAEIRKCIELLETRYGIIPRTFAFPRDYVGHVDALREYGFASFRDVPPKLYPCLRLDRTVSTHLKTQLSLAIQLVSYYIFFPPHVVTSRETLSGLWGTPGCLAYGNKPLVPMKLVTIKAMQGINRAIRRGKIFSMYTHLKEFGANRRMLSELETVLSYVDEKKRTGKLKVKTMTQLAGAI